MVLCTNENIHAKTKNKKKLRKVQFQTTQKQKPISFRFVLPNSFSLIAQFLK